MRWKSGWRPFKSQPFFDVTPTEITALAERRGLKMSDVLKAAGINHSTWWRWQRGKYQPRAESVERIKKALNAKKK
jgi:transcriptional regulator with XRE-family HTH domain